MASFNTIPHEELMKILRKKISDERFLRLIDKLAKAPIMEKGRQPQTRSDARKGLFYRQS